MALDTEGVRQSLPETLQLAHSIAFAIARSEVGLGVVLPRGAGLDERLNAVLTAAAKNPRFLSEEEYRGFYEMHKLGLSQD